MGPPNPRSVLNNSGRTQVTRPNATTLPPAMQQRFNDLGNYSLQVQTTVNIVLFQSRDAGTFSLQIWLQNATSILSQHGMTLNALQGTNGPDTLDYSGGAVRDRIQVEEIRVSAGKLINPTATPLRCPVIICKFSDALQREVAGLTFVDNAAVDRKITLPSGASFLPFCLLDAGSAFPTTLLHEVGHAAGLVHANAAGERQDVMFEVGSGDAARTKLNGVEVRGYGGAYFSTPRITPPYKIPQ